MLNALDIQKACQLLGEMPPATAAAALSRMTAGEAAKLLVGLDDKQCARILNSLDFSQAALFLKTPPMNFSKAADALDEMTPEQVARILLEFNDLNYAGLVCRKFSVDFCSSVFACTHVLQPGETKDMMLNMNDIEFAGVVLFTMKRKVTDIKYITNMLSEIPEEMEANLLAKMLDQARKRMEFQNQSPERLKRLCDHMGEAKSEFLECQTPTVVATMMESSMTIPDAVELMQNMSGDARVEILMNGGMSEDYKAELTRLLAAASEAPPETLICPRCGFEGNPSFFQIMCEGQDMAQKAKLLAVMSEADVVKIFETMMDAGEVEEVARLLLVMDPPGEGKEAAEVLLEWHQTKADGEERVGLVAVAMNGIDAPEAKVIMDHYNGIKAELRASPTREGKGSQKIMKDAPPFDEFFLERIDVVHMKDIDRKNLPNICAPDSWLKFL
ncbi:hypothetical protein CYMTET_33195, partial [Cymbomonas tetramitiformis]